MNLFFSADLNGKNPLINWCWTHPSNKEICAPFSARICVKPFFSEIDQRRKLHAKIRLRLFPWPISITR
jgi:hypothetical protein